MKDFKECQLIGLIISNSKPPPTKSPKRLQSAQNQYLSSGREVTKSLKMAIQRIFDVIAYIMWLVSIILYSKFMSAICSIHSYRAPC